LPDRKKSVSIVAGVVISLLIYVFAGIYVSANSVRIHAQFPGHFYSGELLSCEIRNNAPLKFPFVNPFYTFRVVVTPESTNKAYACFEDISGERWNFTERVLDVGRIDSGEYKHVEFYLYPNGGNAYVRLEVYSSFIINSKVSSCWFYVVYQGNGKYTFYYPC